MNIEEFLDQTDRVFNDEGIPCDFGCSQHSIPTMIEYVKNNLSPYPYTVVSGWKWIDIDVSKEIKEDLKKYGFKPCALFARKVIDAERMRRFNSVRTTLLQGFHNNCIFLTQNTAYILCGPGKRVSINSRVFSSLMG
ncbi:hypothetical protein imdm_938 [gamma proteobacterium IMCC2047]|nr:hypothetical protein imdm_938 [gamma proteobacterium IMCC2047]